MLRRIQLCALFLAVAVAAAPGQQPSRPGPQQPARDTPARQKDALPPPAGRITGRVLAADNGRPVKRARVFITAAELPEGRGGLTDDTGMFDFVELPAGRYNMTVSKSGFVSLAYGQRRPLQAGTPLQLADGQQLQSIEFRLPRGSVIAGHLYDQDGDPMPGVMVRVMRYQYMQGDRRLVPAGTAQTDDKGQYRTSVNEAGPVTVGLSQESLDVDFSLQLIRVARVEGRVTNPDGSATTRGNVTLIADTAVERGGQFGINYGSRIQSDGAFTISNVPPGRYLLRARGDATELPQFATLPLTVSSKDLDGVAVVLAAGASISGTVVFPPGQSQRHDLTQLRITATSTDQQIGNAPQARVDKDGNFTMEGVPTGSHLIRPNGGLRGWTLKSVVVDGRDVTDIPIDLRSGQRLSNVAVALTDKVSEINGTITNNQGVPVTDYTVLAFVTDPSYWRPRSRHIMTARPDQTGKFRIRGLPAGGYYVVTVDPAEQGEWFDPTYLEEHRIGAPRVTLGEGETKTQDFKVKS